MTKSGSYTILKRRKQEFKWRVLILNICSIDIDLVRKRNGLGLI